MLRYLFNSPDRVAGPLNRKIFAVFVALLVIIVIAVLVALYQSEFEKPVLAKAVPTRVKVGAVSEINIPLQVQAVGTILAPETVMLKAQQTGRVVAVYFHPGEHVKQGQVLLQIDPAVLKAKLAQQFASYTQLEAAYKRYDSLRGMNDGGLAAVSAETLQEKLSAAQVAKALLTQAQDAVNETQVVAPFFRHSGFLTKFTNWR